MQHARKLFQKIESKKSLGLKWLRETLHGSAACDSELLKLAEYSNDYYTRNLIYSSDRFQALLLTWRCRQRSPLHNHKGSACVVRVLKGRATEVSFKRSSAGILFPVSANQYERGEVIASYDQDIHQMSNLDNEDLVTLHIYAPGLKKMEIFSLTDTCLERYDELVSKSFTTETRDKTGIIRQCEWQ